MRLYSVHHIIYIVLFFVCIAAAVLIYKYALRSDKARDIFIRFLGGLLAASLIFNRISLTVWNNNGIGIREMIPNTYCGMSSLLLGLCVMLGKPDMKIFHFLFYLELIGGAACVFYPTFLNQGPSFFFLPTITGMNHHALGVIVCIMLAVSKRFTPSFKYWYVFPLGIAAYTVFGLFLIDVLHIRHTMIIDEPVIPHTPLKWWFILIFGSMAETATMFCIDKIKIYRARKRLSLKKEAHPL